MADEIELLRLVSELIPEPTTDAWARAKAAIAAAREEDLLRQDMERSTGDLRAPAGLTRRVARQHRRRLALRSAAAVAAVVAAGAVALAVTGAPGARPGGTDLTAYVVTRVGSALSAAEPAQIAQLTVTTSSTPIPGVTITTTAEEWSFGGRWRGQNVTASGHPAIDEGSSAASVSTVVNYPARTWARGHEGQVRPSASVSGPRGCEPVLAALPVLFFNGLSAIDFSPGSQRATVAGALRTAISCGTLTVAGRQRVDGIEAIELTSTRSSLDPETIWVSPDTYLPVRVVARSALLGKAVLVTADISWLPPTAQNLARLAVPIPAGFRQIPLAEAVAPIPQPAPKSGRPD